MSSQSSPIVLSTSPRDVITPVHSRHEPLLPQHELRFVEPRTPDELHSSVAGADFLLGDWTGELGLGRTALGLAERCRLIVQPAAGYDSVDVDAAHDLGIPVANTPGANTRGVAEWTVMAMLLLVKNAVRNHERTRRGEWWMTAAADEGVHDLAGRTVGILGMGRTGLAVARRLAAFGTAPILYHHRRPIPDTDSAGLPLQRVSDVDELCRRSNVLSLHVPLTGDTRGLIDRRRLRLLGSGGVLVNGARGAVVDEDALHSALRCREIAAAALDVFGDEPLTGDHRWAELDNVFLSPHLAGSTLESREAMVAGALASLDVALRGGLPGTVVNDVPSLPAPGPAPE
ncbi:2-hydroxyacid dehydrogenase [Prauserella halophila]|uniref:2-hydroxyacid dehydrogenase n=1 Tax=Prauserella halophila TaxID=185641 RepID=A0ABN1W3X3_9PSEU|nr:NAD(P)-dependent oxidoreductase [Prauserella halophila]MCP2236141.1 D-3-phosphoglycerate dehydrogenase [Prauserella halophila]